MSGLLKRADQAIPSRRGAVSPLDALFKPGIKARRDLEAYLKRLQERGVKLTVAAVHSDVTASYPLPVGGEAFRKWLTRNFPNLLPWK